MIPANELRIGNWVRQGTFRDMQVTGYLIHVLKMVEDKQSERDHNSFLEPIPLTEEWFEKFGFNKTHLNHGPPIGGEYVEWDLSGYRFLEDTNGKWFLSGYNWNTEHFQYVHELQNLYFALTKEELVII